MPGEVLAFVAATDGIQVRRLQAIRPGHDVIGEDDLRAGGIALVEGAEDAEVVGLLGEAPMAEERLLVEGGEAHAAGLAAFHAHERGLEVPALDVVELVIVLADVLNHPRAAVKVVLRLTEARLQQLAHPAVGLLEAGVHLRPHFPLREGVQAARSVEVPPAEEHDVIRADHLAHLLLGDRAVGGQLMHLEGDLHPLPRFRVDEVLEGRGRDRKLREARALLACARAHEVEQVGWHPLLLVPGHVVLGPSLVAGLQSPDEPSVALHEVTVQDVADGLGREVAVGVLRQGLEGEPEAVLDAGEFFGASGELRLKETPDLRVADLAGTGEAVRRRQRRGEPEHVEGELHHGETAGGRSNAG
mmetsp:Transcript_50614/g.147157  ORF Transcript_50614/g.147157 Transcript_50614/m.147157 type:complete len:359 (-) Transcript_50614:60-1136(-)